MVSITEKNSPFDFLSDAVSGTAVFFVALPLCLGVALASGAPLVAGLLAGAVGGVVVGAISGSHTSVSGPSPGMTAVVIAQIAVLGSFEMFLAALFLAGILQIIFGVAKLGFISAFFPSSVIKGLLAAIGIILILKQLPHLVGWDMDFDGELAFWQPNNENTFTELGRMLIHEGAVIVGVVSLIVMVGWEWFKLPQKLNVPAAVVVVPVGMAAGFLMSSLGPSFEITSSHMVQVPVLNTLNEVRQFFTMPNFSQVFSGKAFLAALTIAIVASLESLININAVDNIDPRQRTSPPNRELIAQGIGNSLLGLIGGIPVTSVIIRSTVNVNAAAKTKRSAIIHGLLLGVLVCAFPSLVNHIPLSCLAAILIFTGLKLANYKIAKQMWRQGLNQFLPFGLTVIAIVFTDLLVGVLIGLAASIFFILQSNLKRPLQVVEEIHFGARITRITLANQASFLNRAALKETLSNMPQGSHVLFDATHADYIDSDILDLIEDYRDHKGPAHRVQVSVVGFRRNKEIENLIHFPEHSTNELQRQLNPNQVLKVLKEGNERVRHGRRLNRNIDKQILATSEGQFPHGVFLSCIDSRAPAELIFDLGIGDMFSARVAGNTISEKILGSLEFACAIAGAKLIVVMGHTRCGAVSAAVEFVRSGTNISEETGCKHLEMLVEDIQEIVRRTPVHAIPEQGTPAREIFEEEIVKKNVEECMDRIVERSETIRKMVANEEVLLAGCVYDVRSGSIAFIREINRAKLYEHGKVERAEVEPIGINLHEEALQL